MSQYMLDRLKEASTWRSIVYVLAAAGVPMAPGMADYVVATGMGIAGVIGILAKDNLK
jgi:hypothetical protein